MAKAVDMHMEQVEILARLLRAARRVQARLVRVSHLLNESQIPYAVIGGHAVAAWVATKDESLMRASPDVEVLVSVEDLERIREVLDADGFVYRRVAEMDIFMDDSASKEIDAVHLIYAGQKIRPDHVLPAPDVDDSGIGKEFKVIPLESLVGMELVAWRRKNRVHLQDLIGVGLIDLSWPQRFPEPLSSRLQELLDNPD